VGISSDANSGSSGNAGTVAVTVSGPVTIRNTGSISSDAYARGNAGDVTVSAGSLLIDGGTFDIFTGISSDAIQGSTGNGGIVSVTVSGSATLQNGAEISSDTSGPGRGGDVRVSAGSLNILGGGSQTNEETSITSDTFDAGSAGKVTVTTGSLTIDNG